MILRNISALSPHFELFRAERSRYILHSKLAIIHNWILSRDVTCRTTPDKFTEDDTLHRLVAILLNEQNKIKSDKVKTASLLVFYNVFSYCFLPYTEVTLGAFLGFLYEVISSEFTVDLVPKEYSESIWMASSCSVTSRNPYIFLYLREWVTDSTRIQIAW